MDELRILVDDAEKLSNETGLADPGNAHDGDELWLEAGTSSGKGAHQDVELVLPPDEWRPAVREVDSEAGAPCDGAPRRDRLGLPLRGYRFVSFVFDRALRRAKRVLIDEDPARGRSRLEARSRVHDVAGDDPLSEVGTRVERDERLSAVHTDPYLEGKRGIGLVHLRDRLLDGQRRAHGTLGVVLVRNRCPERRDDRVSDELLDGAAVALELVSKSSVVRSQESADVLRVEPLGALGRTDHVREQNSDDLPLLAASRRRRGELRPALRAELRGRRVVEPARRAGRHRGESTLVGRRVRRRSRLHEAR